MIRRYLFVGCFYSKTNESIPTHLLEMGIKMKIGVAVPTTLIETGTKASKVIFNL
nr:MAG TPA: hypothetical protein [Caudoviricetes sp.]